MTNSVYDFSGKVAVVTGGVQGSGGRSPMRWPQGALKFMSSIGRSRKSRLMA